MKPSQIFEILNLARRARQIGEVFNPLFVGPPGVGKSQIVQAWCKANNLPFIDLRSAYLEAPDVIGFPSIENISGRQITVHNTPEFWPTDPNWEGVVLLEEPNRGTTSIMNCWMQLLTDRKVHKYSLPEKSIIVGCINPEGAEYDVNTMDAALKDRFEIFQVSYDKQTFVEYMKVANWDKNLIAFVDSGLWSYVLPEDVKNTPGSKYISPRTLSKLNAALKSKVSSDDELLIYTTILGANVGKDFFSFLHNESPVFYKDLVKHKESSLAKLKKFSDPNNFKASLISITVKDILETNEITDELLVAVLKVIPLDQATLLLKELDHKRGLNGDLLKSVYAIDSSLKKHFKDIANYGKK